MAFYGAARGGDVRIVGAHVSGSTACINEQRAELQTITLIRRSKKEREKEALMAYRRFHSCLLPSSRVIVRFKRVAIDRERNLFYSFATRRRKEMNTVKLCESRSRFTRMIKRRSHTLQILINLIKASP